MEYAGPHREWPAGGDVPAGLVVAWEGAVADVPAGWALCDGSGSTPNLSDRFVIGADASTYAYNTSGGSDTASISGSTSTDAEHQPTDGGSAATGGGSHPWLTNSRGAHSHTVSGSVNNAPPHYTLAYIKATKPHQKLPAGSVFWFHDIVTNIPANFAEKTELRARAIKGVAGDARGTGGALTESVTLTTSTAGVHAHHYTQAGSEGGGAPQRVDNTGAHNHTQSLTVTKQMVAYHALTPIKCTATEKPQPGFVCAFHGTLAQIKGWIQCDGDDGSPDLRARQPIGHDGGATYAMNATGGANTDRTCSATFPSQAWVHEHGNGGTGAGGATHGSFNVAHGHTYSSGAGQGAGLPPWCALHYVKFTG